MFYNYCFFLGDIPPVIRMRLSYSQRVLSAAQVRDLLDSLDSS